MVNNERSKDPRNINEVRLQRKKRAKNFKRMFETVKNNFDD